MIKRILLLVFLSLSISTFSQEICDNGIDDDGDGFIDLQDNDCHCGAGLNAQFNNAIPNADFDSSLCCPTTWWDHLNCLADWTTDSTQYYNSWSLNYVNSCNGCNYWNTTAYITPPNCGIGGNNGFLGMGFWNWNNNIYNYNNFANACLNTPLYPGNTYVLEFDAFNTYNYNWQFTDDTIHIAIYGSTSCANIPITNQACNDPDWDGLDSLDIIVPVDTAWHNYAFSFSPTDTVYALALGQTCSSYNNNQTYTGWQRILLDNLTLYDSKIYNLQIADSGSFCNPPYLLTSTIDTLGGTWQWYKDSVALIGETNPTIDITSMGAGNYTVLYQMNGTCQGLNLEILPAVYPFAFISSANTEACVGDSVAFDGISFIAAGTIDNFYYDFGNGDSAFVEDPIYAYSTPGTYSVAFTAESDQGCTAGQT
ncbi:MAG: PKD domain-containing protein, partial [Putridiphycobacter sp.]|nr:PKD domain-containing protein [Putridiphycobacter sp.]